MKILREGLSMAEWLTIFNDDGINIGIKERDQVHLDGDWHETFHCWLFETDHQRINLYFQKRSHTKKDFPSLYDITCAGHIDQDEKVIEAGLRELQEELGVILKEKDIIYDADFKETIQLDSFFDREICHLFFMNLTECKLNLLNIGDEVESIAKVDINLFEQLIKKERMDIPMLELTKEGFIQKKVTKSSFCPHDHEYFNHIIQVCKKLS